MTEHPGDLEVAWIHGSESAKHNTDPDIQVHFYDPDTVILRQNMAVSFEAPFLYLLFGAERALLLDTGATESPELFPLRATIDDLVAGWLGAHPEAADDYGLLVVHSHGHWDHIAGDSQFADRPRTLVAPADRAGAWPFFGFDHDPEAAVEIDLGGRIVDCLATPGHEEAAMTYYDRRTALLLTGDTVYPGRLYIDEWEIFVRTVDRLVDWADRHPISHVLGCHIEMTTTPGVDIPRYTSHHPGERVLELGAAHLRELQAELARHEGLDEHVRYVLPDMIVTRFDG